MSGLQDAVEALRAEWRLDFRVAQRVLAALAAGGSLAEVVAATAADRHDVEEVLRRVEPWTRRDGDGYVLAAAGDLPGAAAPDEPALTRRLAGIAAGLPPPDRGLDHVLARPATMAARACYFAGRYALAGATVLCVGDHDLTSVAVALAEPAAEILVVDIDQRILAYLDRVAAEQGLPITTAFADLRLGLPPSFTGRADLAFTDPPYTPDGVALFLARSLQGLRRSGHERIAFAYGFAGRQLARGFRTQSTLHELRLVLEALLPGFNRFDGAQAIGAASDLYVCRPTRWTWPVLDRLPGADPRIYTRGPAAAEAGSAALDQSIVDEVTAVLGGTPASYAGPGWPAAAGGHHPGRAAATNPAGPENADPTGARPGTTPCTTGGAADAYRDTSRDAAGSADARPTATTGPENADPTGARPGTTPGTSGGSADTSRDAAGSADARPDGADPHAAGPADGHPDAGTPDRDAPAGRTAAAPATDLAGLLAGQPVRRPALAVNLHPHFGALLPAALLVAARLDLAVVVAPAAAIASTVDGPVWTLLRAAGVDVRVGGRAGAAAGLAILRRGGVPATATAHVCDFLIGHPGAKVGNAWRDALIAAAEQRGEVLTKNAARAQVRAAGLPDRALQLRLGELPQSTVAALVAAVAGTAAPAAG